MKVVLGRTRVFFWVMYKMTDGMGRAPVLEHRSRQVLCGGGGGEKGVGLRALERCSSTHVWWFWSCEVKRFFVKWCMRPSFLGGEVKSFFWDEVAG